MAGEVVQIEGSSNIFLGTETAAENLVLGQQLKALLTLILNALLTHTHTSGIGPTGPPDVPAANSFQDALDTVLDDTILSDWIFGQKDPPA